MAETYLLPEDVSDSDAAMVLDFLNQASDAEEIATAVELPDELDIGLRVAARILAQRDELGGFSSLEQVYGVPYVGPERFTELVVSLSNARPPPASTPASVDLDLLAQITQRLNALEAVHGGPSIRLRAINPEALLGRETVILAELVDAGGRPLVDRELTVVTTWGRLYGRTGLARVQGNSVTVRSNHIGLCRVSLRASVGEALTGIEHSSLERALAVLGDAPGSPRDNIEALLEFARLYRAPGGAALRRVIDVHFKHYGDSSLQDTPSDVLSSWPRIPVTIVAWLTPEEGASTTQVSNSLLTLEQRNWCYALSWAYRQLLDGESELGGSLRDVDAKERSGDAILTDLFGRVDTFVNAQRGYLGQQVGQSFASNNLTQFLQTGLEGVSPEERVAVITGVNSGVNSLNRSTQVYSTPKNLRIDVPLKAGKNLSAGSLKDLDALDSRLSGLEATVLTEDSLATLEDSLIERLSATVLEDIDTGTDARIDSLREELTAVLNGKGDVTRLDAIDEQVMSINATSQALDESLKQLDEHLLGINARIDELERRGG